MFVLPDCRCVHCAACFLSAIDYRRGRLGSGTTLMRHARGRRSLARSIPPLPLRMQRPPALGPLVLRARRLHTHPARFFRAPLAAVALATVTARAQDKPLPATLATYGTQPQHGRIVAEHCPPVYPGGSIRSVA